METLLIIIIGGVYWCRFVFYYRNPRFRIAEFQSGDFRIEHLSKYVPLFWHRSFELHPNGDISGYTDSYCRTEINSFKTKQAAEKRIMDYYNFRFSKREKNERKRTYDFSFDSAIKEEVMAEFEKFKQLRDDGHLDDILNEKL